MRGEFVVFVGYSVVHGGGQLFGSHLFDRDIGWQDFAVGENDSDL